MNSYLLPAFSKPRCTSRKAPAPLVATIFAISILAGSALAQSTWKSTTGDFKNSTNWSGGVPTQSGGTAIDGVIDNGGTAVISSPLDTDVRTLELGLGQNTSGNLIVTGAGRVNFTSRVAVGGKFNSNASLIIENGGQMTSVGLPIAPDFGSSGTVTVRGSGSSLQVNSNMIVGGVGAGTLNIENGANVRVGTNGTGTVHVGNEYVANGIINVGNGTAVAGFNAGTIMLGSGVPLERSGTSTLNFSQTNTLTIGATMIGEYNYVSPDAIFNVNQTGSGKTILTAANSIMAGKYTVSNGTMLVNGRIEGSVTDTVEDEVVVTRKVTHTFTVDRTGTLGGTGFIEGITTVGGQASQPIKDSSGNTTGMTPDTRGGTLAPGDGLGLLTFGTDLTLNSSATLSIELGGNVRGISYDALNVGGVLTYGGTLRLTLVNGFQPNLLSTFDLFDGYSSFAGTFESILFETPGYTGTFARQTGILTVVSVPEPGVAITGLLGMGALGLRRVRTRV